ncbi:LmeA family phospholipid-binding protein [Micromonosporaceae bacterium Da 78-11]
MAEVYETQRRPRKRWGRRLLIAFIVLLIIIGAALVALDRFGASYAEREISDRVAQQVTDQKATSEKPDVQIDGVPFLTQVVAGKYQEIRIGLANFAGPTGDGKTIKLPLLDIRAQDVRAPLDTLRTGNGDIIATTVSGTGTIDYPQLVALINQPGLTLSAKDGKLVGAAPVQALGQTFNVSGRAELTVKSGVVQVRFADVTAAGLPDIPLVRNLINAYVQKLAVDVKVPQLPLNLAVQKVEPLADGLKFTAGANEVSLNSGGL